MKEGVLVVFAHPDDESVAAGGTIIKLVEAGCDIRIVSATLGSAGKVHESVKKEYEKFGSLEEMRKYEFGKACEALGVSDHGTLGYKDGEITNKMVWGKLTDDLVRELDKHKPDLVITFDHTGWYYHLDHIGVSIAVMRAVDRAKHEVKGVLLNVFHPPGIEEKWDYYYPENIIYTHEVNVKDVRKRKVEALRQHKSQAISLVKKMEAGEMDEEYFVATKMNKKGREIMHKLRIFEEAK